MKVLVILTIVAAYLTLVTAVNNIKQCSNGVTKPKDNEVIIGNCDDPPCILKRNTQVSFQYKFTPAQDIQQAKNKVFGIIVGLPLPFIGVDDQDACGNFYNEKDEKVGCPLKAGTTYIYKNSIKILPIYPTVSVGVEWGLTDAGRGKDVFCFQVPAKITK